MHLVFGATERESGRCLMTEVTDRRREILEPIIRRWIIPGSRIISDGWCSYDLPNQLDFGVYDMLLSYTKAISLTRPMRPFTRWTLRTHGSSRNVSKTQLDFIIG